MRPKSMRNLLVVCLLVLGFLAEQSAGQVPGDYAHLILTNAAGDTAPAPSGPFDNSGLLLAPAGSVIDVSISYEAFAQANPNVLWGLLVSAQETGFPTNITPPPLFTQPPFNLRVGPTLDMGGDASFAVAVPAGLLGVTAYVQAITFDATSIPNLQLSNGLTLQTTPPRFQVAFSFARFSAGLNPFGLEGVGMRDLDGDTLNTLAPLGVGVAPNTATTDIGIAPGFRFLPILPNVPDAPVNPMARPVTRLAEDLSALTSINAILVDDASFFPPRGEILIQQAGENPFGNKTSNKTNLPNMERATYTGREIDSITGKHKLTGVRRVLPGSTGSTVFPHLTGEFVFGRYTFATSAGARLRTRVGLDATNEETPHVVIPAFTADLGEGVVTRDQDLYLFEEVDAERQGFAVLDRVSHTWHVIEDSVIDVTSTRFWDPMVSIAPDGRSMIAHQRVSGGPLSWDSMPDELYAIRLDGLDWPASMSEVWQVTYALLPEPDGNSITAESREVYMPSVAIVGTDDDNYVAYVGLKNKWRLSSTGNLLVAHEGWEGSWLREEVIVRDYIEVPLVGPGSTKTIPSMPRPHITTDFGETGFGNPIIRFDPTPFVDPNGGRMFLTAGAEEEEEDVYVIRNIEIAMDGTVNRVIQNISGIGAVGGTGESKPESIKAFDLGGHGFGKRAALSPDGTLFAWIREESATADFVMIGASNGSEFAMISDVYKTGSGTSFQEAGEYKSDHALNSLYFADDDNIVFLMGDSPHSDELGLSAANTPRFDLFRYTISTDTMVNLTFTSESPNDFDLLGKIRPGGSFKSEDGRFLYLLRDGPISQGNTSLPVDTDVFNLIGVNLQTFQVFDVTGDEFGGGAGLPNVELPGEECITPLESAAVMQFIEGSGGQAGMRYFTGHVVGDLALTDELYGVDANNPFVKLELTSSSPAGSHITNIASNPYSGSVLFVRTNDADPYASTQHPFAVDLDNFLFLRDLTPSFQVAGQPIGRIVDGSIHFIPPTATAGDAAIFSAGSKVLSDSLGVATDVSTVYAPLANISNPLVEPVPLLIPILSTFGLGVGNRIYLLSAGSSANP